MSEINTPTLNAIEDALLMAVNNSENEARLVAINKLCQFLQAKLVIASHVVAVNADERK